LAYTSSQVVQCSDEKKNPAPLAKALLGDTPIFAVFNEDSAVDLSLVKSSLLVSTTYERCVLGYPSWLFENTDMEPTFLAIVIWQDSRHWLEFVIVPRVPYLDRAGSGISFTPSIVRMLYLLLLEVESNSKILPCAVHNIR
jgi:hypothetical protein